MQLKIVRGQSSKTCTPGQLYQVNGNALRWLAYTMEDVVRLDGKVYGKTAIAAGIYKLRISFSNRFRKYLPEVMAVPDFTGIRIHGGNDAEDTLGCPLIGMSRISDTRIGNCSPAVEKVMRLLREAEAKGEQSTLQIVNHGDR